MFIEMHVERCFVGILGRMVREGICGDSELLFYWVLHYKLFNFSVIFTSSGSVCFRAERSELGNQKGRRGELSEVRQ